MPYPTAFRPCAKRSHYTLPPPQAPRDPRHRVGQRACLSGGAGGQEREENGEVPPRHSKRQKLGQPQNLCLGAVLSATTSDNKGCDTPDKILFTHGHSALCSLYWSMWSEALSSPLLAVSTADTARMGPQGGASEPSSARSASAPGPLPAPPAIPALLQLPAFAQ